MTRRRGPTGAGTRTLVAALFATLTLAPSAWAADGYWIAGADGTVVAFGAAPDLGPLKGAHAVIACLASTPSGAGYWLVDTNGGVYSFGDAAFFGSMAGHRLNAPIVGIVAVPTGNGYWLVGRDGGIFGLGGGARFFGSTGSAHLNQPVVGMAATPSGDGYWLFAGDGGVFSFGGAGFYGSTGGAHLNQPVVGMVATDSGHGYRLVAADGGVFTFGDATFAGSLASQRLSRPIIGMAGSTTGGGYLMVAADGGVFALGDAASHGGATGRLPAGAVGVALPGGSAGCGQAIVNGGPPDGGLQNRLNRAQGFARGRAGVVAVAMVDTASGDAAGNGAGHTALRTASIVKVVIAMALYHRAEQQHRELTAAEQAELQVMIRNSDNAAASRLYDSLGGPAVIDWIRAATGVRETVAGVKESPEGSPWEFTVTTAHDVATILTSLAQAGPITPAHRDTLLDQMRNVVPEQRWGISPAVHLSVAAVKNGWSPVAGAEAWRINCTALIDAFGVPNRWALVIMTQYPGGLGIGYGEDTCQGVAERILGGDA